MLISKKKSALINHYFHFLIKDNASKEFNKLTNEMFFPQWNCGRVFTVIFQRPLNSCGNPKITVESQKTDVETNDNEYQRKLMWITVDKSFTLPQFNQSFHSGTVEKHLISKKPR
jgi:hypothetical protein